MAFRRPDPLIREKLNRAFATLGFDPMGFDPKNPKPLKAVVRQLAKELHPDRNPRDVENKTRLFADIQEAFNLIMDNPEEAAKCARVDEYADAIPDLDERTMRAVLDDMASRGSWAGMVLYMKHRIDEKSELGRYAMSLLDSGVKDLMADGNKSQLEFLCINTSSKGVRVAIMDWFVKNGEAAKANSIVRNLAERREWDALAHCAAAFGQNWLGVCASSLLESNADSVVASGRDKDAMRFLWKKSNCTQVRQAALEGLAKAGEPDAIRASLDGMSQRKEWLRIIATEVLLDESHADLKRYSVELLERNLGEVLKITAIDTLLHLWDRLSSDRPRQYIIDWLVEAGDFEAVKRLMEYMEQNGRWVAIVSTHSRLPPGHSKLTDFTLSLLERNLQEVIASGRTEIMVFLYNYSKDGKMGHAILAGLAETGNYAGAKELLAVMANKGRWDEIKEEAAILPEDDPLRAHGEALLEKNSRQVIASGRLDTVDFMCRSARSDGTVVASLKGASRSGSRPGIKSILDIMSERRMWKEMKEAASRTLVRDRELRDYSLSLLETHVGDVIGSAGADVIVFLWENAKGRGIKTYMLEELAKAGNMAAVKPMLSIMAQRGMWKGLTYCATEVFTGRPEMRRYTLSLMEDKVRQIVDSGTGDALDFLRQNTMKAYVLDTVYGRTQHGVFHAAARKARSVWDRLPIVGSA
jgi:curved DNA-binding protein CbpA